MEKKEQKRILTEETVAFGGMLLRYRLVETSDPVARFRLCAANGAETAEAPLGNDLCFAADCYRAARNGRAMPCTLSDIVEDLRLEAANFEKPLYK